MQIGTDFALFRFILIGVWGVAPIVFPEGENDTARVWRAEPG